MDDEEETGTLPLEDAEESEIVADEGDAVLLCAAVPVESGILELPVPPCDDSDELEVELAAVPVDDGTLELPVPYCDDC